MQPIKDKADELYTKQMLDRRNTVKELELKLFSD